MLSVISAVKGRIDITEKCFKSIWEKCSDPKNIEHLVLFDCHDRQMAAYLEEYSKYCLSNNLRTRIDKVCFCDNMDQYKNRNMHEHYWNPLANNSKGDIIFGLCNDFVIETQNYDVIMEESLQKAIHEYGHDIFQIMIDDDYFDIREKLNETKYCSSIILSRAALEVFNGIAPTEYSSQGADIFTAEVFASTHINSRIDLIKEVRMAQFSVQRGNYRKDNVQTERPTLDISRPGHAHRMDILFGKKYYHSLINSLIFKKYLKNNKQGHHNG